MVTVPACDDCNGAKARHDDFLRDMLVTDFAGAESPIAQQIFETKTIRSHQQNKSLVGRITQEKGLIIPMRNADGILDTAVTYSFDFERSIAMFSFIIRGLFFAYQNVVLPKDCEFKIGRAMKDDIEAWINMFNQHGGANVRKIGDGEVFSCAYNFGANQKFATFWVLEFYGRVHFSAITTPAGFRNTSPYRARI